MKSASVSGSGPDRTQAAVPLPSCLPGGSATETVLWSKDEAVGRLGGDEELFWELCEIFLQESPKLLQKLGKAVAESDADAVMRAAHSLKGELGYLGAVNAVQASGTLEQMGHEKNLSEAADVFASLELSLADLHRAMKASAGATR